MKLPHTIVIFVPILIFLAPLGAVADENKLDSTTFKQTLDREIEAQTQGLSSAPISSYEARAWCYYQLGNYQKAVDDYSEAIRLSAAKNKTAEIAYFGRASAYRALNKYDETIADFKQAQKEQAKLLADRLLNYALIFMLIGTIAFLLLLMVVGWKKVLHILSGRK